MAFIPHPVSLKWRRAYVYYSQLYSLSYGEDWGEDIKNFAVWELPAVADEFHEILRMVQITKDL